MKGEAEKPVVGRAEVVASDVQRILDPNPGPMTYWGTNTYLLGTAPMVVVDPGPDIPAHKAAILAAIGGARVAGVLITHPHRDHSALAPALACAVGAPVMGFGPPGAGRSALMTRVAERENLGGGEGVDHTFVPDVTLAEGAGLTLGDTTVTALHTPGHFAGHLSFVAGDVVLTGDVVMGWSTTLISPPDGDVRAFLQTAGRLRALGAEWFLPGHGPAIDQPTARLDWLIAHWIERKRQVCAALEGGSPATAAELAAAIYYDLDTALLPAATRNVLAHLLDLWDRGKVHPSDGPLDATRWSKR